MGRKFLGATKNVLGATFYLETGHSAVCQFCDGPISFSDRIYHSTFRRGFRREHHIFHEKCFDGFRAQLEGVSQQMRQIRGG